MTRPSAAELRKAHTALKDTLRAVIEDGETVVLTDDAGEVPVAVLLPYQTYQHLKARLS